MLRSMLEYAKLSASTLAGRVVGGAIVVVPFIIAALFALAAIYMALANSYGGDGGDYHGHRVCGDRPCRRHRRGRQNPRSGETS